MPSTNLYPPLKQILPKVNLSIDLTVIEGFLDNVFDNLYYQNLIVFKSPANDAGYYRFDLITYKRIGYEIPGTNGLALLLNPDFTEDGVATSVFEGVTFNYQLEILKYLEGLSPSNFQADPLAYFNLLLSVAGLSVAQILEKAMNLLIGGEDPIDQFITNFNAVRGLTDNIVRNSGLDFNEYVDIAIQIADRGFDNYAVIFEDYINKNSLDDIFQRISELFQDIFGDVDFEEIFKKLLIPQFLFSTGPLELGLQFPLSVFQPFDPSFPDEKTILRFNVGELGYNSEEGLLFNSVSSFDFPKSYIFGTQFYLEATGLKIDLSKTRNLQEASAEGRPVDFVGVYITEGTIGFPADWGHNPDDSTAELFVKNLLVGTGGISGTIGMRGVNGTPLTPSSLISAKFGAGFEVGLAGFELVFQQNAIISSDIHGWMKIPGFKDETGGDATIQIKIHIGQDGEFNVIASAVPALKKIGIDGVFDFYIESLFFGRETGDDGRFYIGIGGELDFTMEGFASQFLPDKLDIKKLLIYDDGKFEFEGGKLVLPKAVTVKFGPAILSITGIHSGTYEKDRRPYKFFGFDGGVKTTPGGVEAHGKGIKYYYSTDDGPFDWFIRLESLKIDIVLPSGTDPEKAAVVIRGFLSIAEPKMPVGLLETDPLYAILQNSQEYSGGVSVSLPKFRGLKGSAAMRLNPKVPSFIVDLEIEMTKAIPLGTTGLGIYGFRALLGKKYVATKTSAGIPEDGEWWQYYKAKIDPDYEEGIQVSKFDTKNGFSFGAGVSLATSSDAGKTFSSKLFFLLSLPDVFLFQGQAQFLKERIGLDANPDPPFFAIIAITSHSIEAGFGVNYKLRDNGKLVTVDGVIELGFFWGDSKAWYVNVGRETPEDRRIQARLFDILNMYFYLMMSNNGIRLGAGVKFEWAKKFGPLSAELKAYIDTFGKISKRPKQIGGAIKMGGKVSIKVCGFGFGVSGSATLAAEAPNPHIITGEFEVCVTVLKKERCARFEFTWSFNEDLDTNRVPLLVAAVGDGSDLDMSDLTKAVSMTHMVTGERFAIAAKIPVGADIPAPDTWITGSSDDYRVPVDAFLDVEFKKGMNVSPDVSNNLGRIGGQSTPAKFVEFSPPLRGKSDRVRHEFYLKNVEIFYWDEAASPAIWKPYNFYEALRPIYENAPGSIGAILGEAIGTTEAESLLADLKWGYWQQEQPGVNNKLRLLATSPLSYTSGTGNAYTIENFGVNDNTIFCGGDAVPNTCLTFGPDALYDVYPQNTLRGYENVLFRVLNSNGTIINTTYESIANGLFMEPGATLEIFFNEPMKFTNLLISSQAPETVVKYYRRNQLEETQYGLTNYEYTLVETINYTDDYEDGIPFTPSDAGGVDYISIQPINCTASGLVTNAVANQATILSEISSFIHSLVHYHHFTAASVELYDDNAERYASFFTSSLYGKTVREGDTVMLNQTYFSPVGLSFTITDNSGYSCLYTFNLFDEVADFDYSTITGVKSISMHTADDAVGSNNNFLIIFDVVGGGTVRFIGSTCHELSYSYSACATGFYKLCYLSLENYLLNQTIPSSAEQQAANATMIQSINKTLQPIWRPNTTFAVRLTTEDRLYREGGSSGLGTYTEKVIYGFRTAGPIGHFHRYPKLVSSAITSVPRADYNALDEVGKADEFRLTNLATYIDYSKSYPNADGQLINAKPLFYNGAILSMFYTYNHVYQFYTDWVDYEHVAGETIPKIAESSLEIRILNPAPTSTTDESGTDVFIANRISHDPLVPGGPPSLINEVNSEISVLNNLLVNGNPCATYQPMAPIDLSSAKMVNLKPLKLYTAQFVAHYNPRINGNFAEEAFEAVVHSYVFQTSRYGSFTEQVNSYVLKRSTAGAILREAIYPVTIDGTINVALAQKVIVGNLTAFTDIELPLVQQYADRFDQLMNGVLAIDANRLQTMVNTEFNLVKNNGKLIGILIRNPEPFNDPKIPTEVIQDSIQMRAFISGVWGTIAEFVAVHSKDRSQVFITNSNYSFEIDQESKLEFTFNYKIYDGVAYENDNTSTTIVEIDLNNHPI